MEAAGESQIEGSQPRARGGRVRHVLVTFLFDTGIYPGELFRKISKSHSEGPNVASCKIRSKKEKRKREPEGLREEADLLSLWKGKESVRSQLVNKMLQQSLKSRVLSPL